MNTRKFEYLETIREHIEQGDYDELKDYVELIRDRVRQDPDFEDIFIEINRGRYQDVITIIDDLIYKDMQDEMEAFGGNGEGQEEDKLMEENMEKLSLELDLDEDMKEEISFEPFDEEGYLDKSDDDNF